MTITSQLRRPRTWFIAVPLLALLAAVGGPWAYINLIMDDPPAELSFADIAGPASKDTSTSGTSSTSTSGATGADSATPSAGPADTGPTGPTDAAATADVTGAGELDGVWTVASGSQAGYRVPEVLFGQDTEGVGRTSDVSGSLTIDGASIAATEIEVDLTTVASDSSQRDGQFRNRIMETSTYPTATFRLASPITLSEVPDDLEEVTIRASGELTLKGVTNLITVDLVARRNGDAIEVTGSLPVAFADYGIDNPSFGGISVGDTGTIEFAVVFARP